MSNHQTWAEALKISPEKLSEWSEKAPADIPLLVWCLQQGEIRAEEYLDWACENFGLPVLNSAFFTQSFDKSTLEQYRKDPNYCAWSFPVAFWDDVYFIACAEPPREAVTGFAYILADPAAMKEVWRTEEDEDGNTASGGGPKTGTNIDMPIGMKAGPGTFVLNLDESTLLKGHKDPIDPNPAKKPSDEHTGLTLSVMVDPTAEPKGVNFPPNPAPEKTRPAKPGVAAAVQAPKLENTATMTKTKTEFDPPPTPAPKKTGTRTNISALNVNEDSEVAAGFESLHRDYQSALIMRCTEHKARPYKWDKQLTINADDERYSFNLNLPSFFRIVAKTLQPYHGYVIESPAHKEFFLAMGFATLPACVTAIPLTTGGAMWGILIAFGGEGAQSADALTFALGISEKLIKALEPNMSRAS